MFTARCHEWLEQQFGVRKVLLTHSCTASLEMAAILCEIGAGNEVLVPSFTFVSTANAFLLCGARPVFVDIRPDTLNMDEHRLAESMTPNTRAIVAVHYAGIACEMDAILALAREHGVRVIEDAAQGVNATYKDRFLGSMGDLGCWSFHETKNFICGEGGALVINDESLVERAEIIREKGTNRGQFVRGETDKYTWVDIGSSYLPSEIVAAFLYAQLEEAEKITKRRWDIYRYYIEGLTPLHESGKLQIPSAPAECVHNAHMVHVLARFGNTRRVAAASEATRHPRGFSLRAAASFPHGFAPGVPPRGSARDRRPEFPSAAAALFLRPATFAAGPGHRGNRIIFLA